MKRSSNRINAIPPLALHASNPLAGLSPGGPLWKRGRDRSTPFSKGGRLSTKFEEFGGETWGFHQRGVALVISLIFLLLVTLLGLIAMRTTNLEESMANNTQDRMMAFQATEAALRAGEQDIANFLTPPTIVNSNPSTNQVWIYDPANTWPQQNAAWWADNTRQYNGNLTNINTQPYYALEYQTSVPDSMGLGHSYGAPTGREFYRVSARGTGITDDALVVLQTTTTKRFN